MHAPVVRRQNHSCDQCRRSKRRCVADGDSASGKRTCRYCKHVGNRCTYDFIHSRSASKKSAKSLHLPVAVEDVIQGSQHELTSNLPTPSELDWTTTPPAMAFDATNFSENMDWLDVGFTTDYSFDIFCDPFADILLDTTGKEHSQTQITATSMSAAAGATGSDTRAPPNTSDVAQCDARSWLGSLPRSPISLLSSTLTQELPEDDLAGIHDSVMASMSSRFLSYGANVFAGYPV